VGALAGVGIGGEEDVIRRRTRPVVFLDDST
jgi:hypothetical protein